MVFIKKTILSCQSEKSNIIISTYLLQLNIYRTKYVGITCKLKEILPDDKNDEKPLLGPQLSSRSKMLCCVPVEAVK